MAKGQVPAHAFKAGNKAAVGHGRPKSPYVCVRAHLGKEKLEAYWDKMYKMFMEEGDVAAGRVIAERLPMSDPIPTFNYVKRIDTHREVDKEMGNIVEWSKDPNKALTIEQINVLVNILMKKRDTIDSAKEETLQEIYEDEIKEIEK